MSSYGLWLSAACMKVQEHRQTVLANNMANAATTGFKQELAVVTQRDIESRSGRGGLRLTHPVLDGLGGGVNVRPSARDFSQGSIERTGRPFDVAIEGEGFFTVSDGTSTRYTRNGEFTLNSEGELVLTAAQGQWRVLDDAGSVIGVDRAAGPVSILGDGTIHQGRDVVARLGVVDAEDKQALRKTGETLFEADEAEMQPRDVRVVSGSREASNVNVMRGLVSMIEASRAYQMNATMIQLQDQMTGQAVTTVGRIR